ncbi:MAG: GxxExxY protein [Cyclobacteriaceae bacterium]|nr:GxxExxY protein [Cyclobacteriaceae bacterium]
MEKLEVTEVEESLEPGFIRILGLQDFAMEKDDLTGKIIGCAMKVHSTLGNGFQEVIYQRALAIEMEHAGLLFAREKEMAIFYRDIDIGTRRVDFFVENEILVEIKAISKLEDVHLAQAKNYLEAFGLNIRASDQFW